MSMVWLVLMVGGWALLAGWWTGPGGDTALPLGALCMFATAFLVLRRPS